MFVSSGGGVGWAFSSRATKPKQEPSDRFTNSAALNVVLARTPLLPVLWSNFEEKRLKIYKNLFISMQQYTETVLYSSQERPVSVVL